MNRLSIAPQPDPPSLHPVRGTSHVAWDVRAVHGVHAMHSVRNLGTASSVEALRQRAGAATMFPMACEAAEGTRWRDDDHVGCSWNHRVWRPW